MPLKFAGKNGRRGGGAGGAPFNPPRNSRYLPGSSENDKLRFPSRYQPGCSEGGKSRFPPKYHTPSKFSDNQGRRNVAGAGGRKMKQVWRPKPPPPPPWTELPRDITANILHRLGAVEILETAQKVCTTWRSVCKDPAMWRVIDMNDHGYIEDSSYDLEIMCRHAVDRSQGQLIEIHLNSFPTDELLDYIATRSGKLRRLRLSFCYNLSSRGLIEAIKRLPELEELHIIHFFVSNDIFEVFSHSCPLLRSFSFNIWPCVSMGDENAMAIARSMPELRHLQLMGNGLTNEGLEAILDGCPHLESLDLRRCSCVDLKGDLGKRCSTQIKCLRYPEEPVSYNGSQADDSDFFDDYSFGYPDFFDYDDYDFEDYSLYVDDDFIDVDSDIENFPLWLDD